MSKENTQDELYEGSTYEAFAGFIENARGGKASVFTDTDTGNRIFTESALRSEVRRVLDRLEYAYKNPVENLGYLSMEHVIEAERKRYEII